MDMSYMFHATLGYMLSSPHAELNDESRELMNDHTQTMNDFERLLFSKACDEYVDMCVCQAYERAERKEHRGQHTKAAIGYCNDMYYHAGQYKALLDLLKRGRNHEKRDNSFADAVILTCKSTLDEVHVKLNA